MTAERFMGDFEEYPRGLRVLAVDDDLICLKLLKALLQKCQYKVETANQARVALKMLRENRDRFDLVISDVHMPDMDGFKLLELVGLEMDLPVIMLSANNDPKLVLKGVTHGACDYLVKPVRFEELSNIWQHVIRRKKFVSTGQAGSIDQATSIQQNCEDHSSIHENQDVNVNRKRKDEDDDSEGDDPASQKKPRVVWSMVLHRKFVAAVNQLGYDKAVPKRILDLMNVEGLTRENVASHLQKYRLYLKRISSDAKQAAALNSQCIPSYAASLGDMYFSAAGRHGTSARSSYTTGEMLRRPDASSGLGSLRGLMPPSLIQLNHVNGLGTPLPCLPSITQNPSGSLNLDQFQMNRHASDAVHIDQSRIYEASNMLNGKRDAAGSSTCILNGPGAFRNHTSHNLATFNSVGLGASILHDAVSKTQPSSLAYAPFHSQLPANTKGDCSFSASPFLQNDTNHSLNSAQAANQRWGVQDLDFDHGFHPGDPSNYDIGTTIRPTSTFTNTMQQSMSKNFPTQPGTAANETFSLLQTKSPDELMNRSYDPFEEMVAAMIKREEDEAVSSCDFELDDYAYGV